MIRQGREKEREERERREREKREREREGREREREERVLCFVCKPREELVYLAISALHSQVRRPYIVIYVVKKYPTRLLS